MSDKKRIKDEVEKTMQSLNSVEKKEVSPFFFSKIQERLNSEAASPAMSDSVMIKVYSPLALSLMLLLLVNTYTILSIQLSTNNQRSDLDTFLNDYEMFMEGETSIQWLGE